MAVTSKELRAVAEAQAEVAQLVADQERARLVASGVIAEYTAGFFFNGVQQRTVLVDLFGSPLTPRRKAAAILFAAIAYLVQEGYCALRPGTAIARELEWVEVRGWDGQVRCLEGKLVPDHRNYDG